MSSPPTPHCSSLPRLNPTYLVEHLSVGRRVPSWIGSSVWGRSGGRGERVRPAPEQSCSKAPGRTAPHRTAPSAEHESLAIPCLGCTWTRWSERATSGLKSARRKWRCWQRPRRRPGPLTAAGGFSCGCALNCCQIANTTPRPTADPVDPLFITCSIAETRRSGVGQNTAGCRGKMERRRPFRLHRCGCLLGAAPARHTSASHLCALPRPHQRREGCVGADGRDSVESESMASGAADAGLAETGRSLTARDEEESTIRPGMTHDLPIFSTWWKRGPSTAAAASAACSARWTKGRNRRGVWCYRCPVLVCSPASHGSVPTRDKRFCRRSQGRMQDKPEEHNGGGGRGVASDEEKPATRDGGRCGCWGLLGTRCRTQARGQARRRGTNLRLGDHGSQVSFCWHRRLPQARCRNKSESRCVIAALNVGIEGPWLGSHGRQERCRLRESVCGCVGVWCGPLGHPIHPSMCPVLSWLLPGCGWARMRCCRLPVGAVSSLRLRRFDAGIQPGQPHAAYSACCRAERPHVSDA